MNRIFSAALIALIAVTFSLPSVASAQIGSNSLGTASIGAGSDQSVEDQIRSLRALIDELKDQLADLKKEQKKEKSKVSKPKKFDVTKKTVGSKKFVEFEGILLAEITMTAEDEDLNGSTFTTYSYVEGARDAQLVHDCPVIIAAGTSATCTVSIVGLQPRTRPYTYVIKNPTIETTEGRIVRNIAAWNDEVTVTK